MKKFLLLIVFIFISIIVFSQEGIETKRPEQNIGSALQDSLDNRYTKSEVDALINDSIANVLTVGKFGCNYTKIQSALNNASAYDVILVNAGIYMNDSIYFTGDYQRIYGLGRLQTYIYGIDTTLINIGDYTGCSIINMSIVMTPTGANDMIYINNGNVTLDNCLLSQINSTSIATARQPSIVHIDSSGEIGFLNSMINYTNDGNEATAIKVPFVLDLDGYVYIDNSSYNVDADSSAEAVAMASFGGNGEIKATNNNIDVDAQDADYVVGAGYVVTHIVSQEFINNDINVNRSYSGAGEVTAFYASGGTASSIESFRNNITVTDTTGSTDAYAFVQAGTPTILSEYDAIRDAVGGVSGTVTVVSSLADGQFDTDSLNVNGGATIDGITTFNAGVLIDDTVHVTGDADFKADVNIDGNLTGVDTIKDSPIWNGNLKIIDNAKYVKLLHDGTFGITDYEGIGVTKVNGGFVLRYDATVIQPYQKIVPNVDIIHDLGSSSYSFNNLYIDDIILEGKNGSTVISTEENVNTASGVNLTINAGNTKAGGTADLNGGMLTLAPGIAKDTGIASVRLQRNNRSSVSGTVLNTLSDAVIVPSENNLVDNVAKSLFEVALGTDLGAGGTIEFSIVATDGDTTDVYSGTVVYSCANASGTILTNISEISGVAINVPAGVTDMSTTWYATAGASKVTIGVTANTTWTPTAIKINYTITNNGTTAITQL